MTDSDLRELDGWIAEHFMGWKPLEGEPPITVRDGKAFLDTTGYDLFKPSTDPSSFALVKREIERRGWEWEARYRQRTFDQPIGRVAVVDFTVYDFSDWDSGRHFECTEFTEEIAGCLAVKAAVESISSSISV